MQPGALAFSCGRLGAVVGRRMRPRLSLRRWASRPAAVGRLRRWLRLPLCLRLLLLLWLRARLWLRCLLLLLWLRVRLRRRRRRRRVLLLLPRRRMLWMLNLLRRRWPPGACGTTTWQSHCIMPVTLLLRSSGRQTRHERRHGLLHGRVKTHVARGGESCRRPRHRYRHRSHGGENPERDNQWVMTRHQLATGVITADASKMHFPSPRAG